MDNCAVMECVGHIRAAAKICEDDGRLAHWATLLGVADQLLEAMDSPLPNVTRTEPPPSHRPPEHPLR